MPTKDSRTLATTAGQNRHHGLYTGLCCLAVLVVASIAFIGRGEQKSPVTRPTPTAPSPAASSTGTIREYTFVAKKTRWELRPGLVTDAYAYNGQVPGPEIRIKLGETVKVTLENELDEPTTIHWHGIRVPAAMDGVPYVSQKPVMPGESFTYEFTPPDAGTFFYHSHVNVDDQVDRGLYGAFIVEPADAVAPRDAVFALDDWLLGADGNRLPTSDSLKEQSVDNALDAVSEKTIGDASAGGNHMMGGGGMMGDTMMPGGGMMAHRMPPRINGRFGNILAVNGKIDGTVSLADGENLLARFINASNSMTHVLKADDGRLLSIVAVDGTRLAEPVLVDKLVLPPAKRFDALIEQRDAKPWTLVSDRAGTDTQIRIAFDVTGASDSTSLALATLPPTLSSDVIRSAPDATFRIATDNMMSPTRWTLNGISYDMENPGDAVATFRKGQWAKIRFVNASPMSHTMHLHGQFMRVVSRNGEVIPNAPQEDTIVVRPMETVDVVFMADNPGEWVLHCHNLEHEETGLMAKVRVR